MEIAQLKRTKKATKKKTRLSHDDKKTLMMKIVQKFFNVYSN